MKRGPTTHTVSAGEWIGGIAASYGFGDPDKIWQHGNNSALRQKRRDPNQLVAGDALFIPAPEPAQLSLATGTLHRLVAQVPAAELKLELLDAAREPLADQPYRLVFGAHGEGVVEGMTSGSGAVNAFIPASCAEARLLLPALGIEYALRLGGLDPMLPEAEQDSGASARLQNLGFLCTDGSDPDDAREAVCSFQRTIMGVEPSGQLDDATRQRLEQEHGS